MHMCFCVLLYFTACMLYYCNTVGWAWWDWDLIWWLTILLQCFDAVGWVTWPVKISSPNDLYCVEWDVKPYSTTTLTTCSTNRVVNFPEILAKTWKYITFNFYSNSLIFPGPVFVKSMLILQHHYKAKKNWQRPVLQCMACLVLVDVTNCLTNFRKD